MFDLSWYRRVSFQLPTEETLTIEKLVYGGEGLARLDGKVVLVPYVLPGEIARVEIERVKNDLFRGRLIELITRSPARVVPDCPYFERCGGCHYQHIDYSQQVEAKREILREVLRRVGKIDFAGDIAAITGEPWHYRNRGELHVVEGALGYFEHGSHRLCPIDHCPIASPRLNQAISQLNTELRGLPPFSANLELFTNESEVQLNVPERVPRHVITRLESVGTGAPIHCAGFRVSRNSFFQVNRFLIEALVECAIADATGETAVDLYAGVGLFSGRLADRFQKVTAVEAGHSAIRDLEHNLGTRVSVRHQEVEQFLTTLRDTPDFILADPPRTGLGKQVVHELARIHVPRLAIVACDPATLARDLQGLLAAGYHIQKLTLVDLFPQTFHLETVVHLNWS